MPTTQPPTGDVVQISPFLNLAVGIKWVYDNLNAGGTFNMSCDPFPSQSDCLQLTVDPKGILPDMVMEVAGVSERQYRWLKATMRGTPLTWQGGLLLPSRWKVGETVTATSIEHSPLSQSPTIVSLQLLNMPHQVIPDQHWPPLPLPPNTLVIEIDLILKDAGLGAHLI